MIMAIIRLGYNGWPSTINQVAFGVKNLFPYLSCFISSLRDKTDPDRRGWAPFIADSVTTVTDSKGRCLLPTWVSHTIKMK